MKYKLIICSMFPLFTMCHPIISQVKNSQRVPNENRAKEFEDFDDSKHILPHWRPTMNYKIGDRFTLKQPMYLHYDVTGCVQLVETSLFTVPQIEKYNNDPDLYKYGGDNAYQIICLFPKGTIIKFVASKSSGGEGALYYFVKDGEDNWFRCSSFKRRDEIRVSKKFTDAYKYNDELFEKL